jgi:hypothetical protein
MGAWIEDYVLDLFARIEERYAADRAAIPAGRLAELRYEDLAADPKAAVRRLYAELALGPFERVELGIDAYLAGRGRHKAAAYDLPADRRARIAARLGPYRARFGYT